LVSRYFVGGGAAVDYLYFLLTFAPSLSRWSSTSTNMTSTDLKKANDKRTQNLEQRVEDLEYAAFYPSNFPPPSHTEHEQMMRARKDILSLKMYSVKFTWVPEYYYSLTLQERADILGARSTSQLCKSMLMENKAFDPNLIVEGGPKSSTMARRNLNPLYSQFYLVILQYNAVISMKKLQSELRALMTINKRFEPSKFDFRVASDQDNDTLTGFMHNAVTPFGIKEKVPIILAQTIVSDTEISRFIWMGGGHVHLKVGVSIAELIDALNPLVLDVTEPRI
jgi:prolyl-tRNA editing enzyme YbaK/EbsC (Cys-tRNA(Pro) deacylase)